MPLLVGLSINIWNVEYEFFFVGLILPQQARLGILIKYDYCYYYYYHCYPIDLVKHLVILNKQKGLANDQRVNMCCY